MVEKVPARQNMPDDTSQRTTTRTPRGIRTFLQHWPARTQTQTRHPHWRHPARPTVRVRQTGRRMATRQWARESGNGRDQRRMQRQTGQRIRIRLAVRQLSTTKGCDSSNFRPSHPENTLWLFNVNENTQGAQTSVPRLDTDSRKDKTGELFPSFSVLIDHRCDV